MSGIIGTWHDLTPARRRDLRTAVTMLERAAGRDLAAITFMPQTIRTILSATTPAACGVGDATFRAYRGLIAYVLKRLGLMEERRRAIGQLLPAWAPLLEQLTERKTWIRLRAFLRFCSERGAAPGAVNDAVLAAYLEHLQASDIRGHARDTVRRVAHAWNLAVDEVPGWPAQRLVPPAAEPRRYALPFDCYPPSLQADVEAFRRRLAGGDGDSLYPEDPDDDAGGPSTPLRPASIRTRMGAVRLLLGAPPYGYRKVRRFDGRGEPVLGLREIDPAKAAVVRRVFEDYVAGRSPRAIAAALNGEGVPGPAGTPWYDTTIRGRPKRGDGILRNPIYIGQLRWNRSHKPRDPVTGRHVHRQHPPGKVVEAEVPELRVIDDAVWERAQTRLAKEAAPKRHQTVPAFWESRRPKHLLSGKVVCGACGGGFSAMGKDYLGCLPARRGHGCTNRRRVRRPKLEAMVMEALAGRLMRPDRVAAFYRAFIEEWNRTQAAASAETASHKRELQGIQRKLDNLVEAIADGVRAPGVQRRLEELEARREQLLAALESQPVPPPALHPNLAEVYANRVAVLRSALEGRNDPELMEAARALVDKVIISPGEGPDDPPAIELVGQLVEMLRAGGAALATEDATVDGVVNIMSVGSAKKGSGGKAPSSYSGVPPQSPGRAASTRFRPRSLAR